MIVLQVSNFTKYFGADKLFENINFSLGDKERVALIGANGTGKSTILKMLIGLEDISANKANEAKGSVAIAKGATLGYLSQDVINDLNHTLIEEALTIFTEHITLEKEIEQLAHSISLDPNDNALHEQFSRKTLTFERLGGYDYHFQIEMILTKFGFSKEDFNRKISSFSGGERTKMAFAKLLLIKPEILILDEPTNHLDISTIDWLENYLKSYSGAILFVSHDRYFVNAIATRILELENNMLTSYKGNYDSYIINKKERYEQMLKEYNLQQKEIEKIQRFITYFKPKPRFVSRAKDREKKLEHMDKKVKPLTSTQAIKFKFHGEMLEKKKTLYFENCVLGYDTELVKPFTFTFFSEDHLAIMGGNGVGKTTLLKSIMGETALLSGSIKRLRPLNVGYLRQNDFLLENSSMTVLEHLTNEFPELGENKARLHLGKFAFQEDDVFKLISVLSGGERMRLILAKLVLKNYDLLLLDEPTNHLDLLTREALIEALQGYKAALIIVSHDRYFVDALANKILYIYQGNSYFHEGNFESFKLIENQIFSSEKTEKIKEKKKVLPANSKPKINKAKLEEQIDKLERRLKEIAELEFLEENYMFNDKMAILEEERKNLQTQVDGLFLEYAEITED